MNTDPFKEQPNLPMTSADDATATITVTDMQCSGCESVIETALNSLPGVSSVNASYSSGKVVVKFNASAISLKEIMREIAAKGYTAGFSESPSTFKRLLKILVALTFILTLFAFMFYSRHLWHQFKIPEISSQAGNGMIVLVGVITGLHCIGMCESFVIGYTANNSIQGCSSYRSHLLYGAGKTFSYALFGGLFGFLGSLFKITTFMSGISALTAGAFLFLFGLNTLNVFSPLKRIRIKQPAALAHFALKRRQKSRSPFLIGFFSGFLLGCGPLQAMYVLAAGNADVLEGLKMLALFGLGTLLAFGDSVCSPRYYPLG
ncbi:MAG: sulfite exporter TauE/SafE family protein [Methylococcaceae bacterium]|nr:sulfite exporter TauE/SafE family protein [Methylococcaceae bacterium]